jgi:hypothetical protein
VIGVSTGGNSPRLQRAASETPAGNFHDFPDLTPVTVIDEVVLLSHVNQIYLHQHVPSHSCHFFTDIRDIFDGMEIAIRSLLMTWHVIKGEWQVAGGYLTQSLEKYGMRFSEMTGMKLQCAA